jgi:hypothetical protein
MLPIFLIVGCGICALDAFGVAGLLDSPGTKEHMCCLVDLLKACKDTSNRKQLSYLVLKGNWITLVVIINLDICRGRKKKDYM